MAEISYKWCLILSERCCFQLSTGSELGLHELKVEELLFFAAMYTWLLFTAVVSCLCWFFFALFGCLLLLME